MREKARGKAALALRDLDWGRTARAIRMNGIDTRWAYGDVIEVVTTAREALDVIIVPKVRRRAGRLVGRHAADPARRRRSGCASGSRSRC